MRLVRWFLRVVEAKKPRFWVMENVPALARHYLPHVRHFILNAADYGVPQTRVRAFFGNFPCPPPTHSRTGGVTLDGRILKRWVGVGEALGIDCVHYKTGHTKANFREGRFRGPDQPSHTVEGGGGLAFLAWRHAKEFYRPRVRSLTEPSFTVVDLSGGGGRLTIHLPAHTVTATEYKYCPSDPRRGSRSLGRRLTVEECMVLQGFPPGYVILGTKQERYKQVGNAVPPPVARAIAEEMLRRW
jgi:DNA (cytosine-5)-methyltransferase 1